MSGRTKGPLQVAGQFPGVTFIASRGASADVVARCDAGVTGMDHAANAAFIALAWNNHDALVEALKGLLSKTPINANRDPRVKAARALLSTINTEASK